MLFDLKNQGVNLLHAKVKHSHVNLESEAEFSVDNTCEVKHATYCMAHEMFLLYVFFFFTSFWLLGVVCFKESDCFFPFFFFWGGRGGGLPWFLHAEAYQ